MEWSSSRGEVVIPAAGSRPASPLVEGNQHMRDIDWAPPGDVVRKAGKGRLNADLAKQKSKRSFFEDAFSINPTNPARERVHGDAIIIADVKTNVIVRDEFAFMTDLACELSVRYQRPVSSVAVTLQHGTCLLFGGSFDPAYIMAVCALPSQLQPTTNKRNAALLQRHMEEALGVPPSRGVLRFVPVPEEHLACGGKTVAGEIEELEMAGGYGRVGLGQCSSRGSAGSFGTAAWSGRPSSPVVVATAAEEDDEDGNQWGREDRASRELKGKRRLSIKSLTAFRNSSAASMAAHELTPPGSADEESSPIPGSYSSAVHKTEQVESGKKGPQRKKSLIASFFGRSGSKLSDRSSLPAIADGDVDT